jgi:acetylornithine/N-succinyldiaminopimelate aminotransferase
MTEHAELSPEATCVDWADDYLTANYARYPVEFVRGGGTRLWDAEGNEYLDFLTGISVSSVGHCHPAVVEAIREQAGRLLHVGNLYYTDPMARLARRLAESSLGGRVFFANSGAEAVEAALKCARKAKQGGTVVSVHGAFHGRTYGALSATPQEAKQAPFAPLVGGFVAVRPTADALRAVVDDSTAAVILEPIQGESGVHVLSDDLLRTARAVCDQHAATLIFDEIQTGLGRTGTAWAYQQSGVVPDLMATAKALGGGLPIGALITGPRLADTFAPGDHGSTFAGGPLVCAAAHAALDVLLDEAVLGRARELGERLREGLTVMPHVTAVRGRGLMIGFDVDLDATKIARRALFEERLVINATGPGTLRLLPALIVDQDEVDEALVRIGRLLAG